ncbi:MAG: polyprenyl diphosphate synthase [Betaproteobacteria bacterium]|nr:polyprenyl diphosphate synthase [Betaproteobacteria bacterium]
MPLFKSATRELPEIRAIPRHVAIIMDGNGRWAKKRFLPRIAGHTKGVETVRQAVAASIEQGIEYLTLFAFSSENWRRPIEEVNLLMRLFVSALENEVAKLKKNGVRLRVIGDLSRFAPKLQELIRKAEKATAENSRLHLTIAANYGGRWDIMNAMNQLAREKPEAAGHWTEAELETCLSTAFAPEPDLFIRTGGEERISNFLLWQLAYTEFYFTETLWPEFGSEALKAAILSYQRRERRFGRTSGQLTESTEGEDKC